MASNPEDRGGGYGKPPMHSQFKKGRSGNPNGRPKGVGSIKAVLTAELNETLTVTENGKACTVTKLEAVVKSLTAAALTDPRAVKTLFALMRQVGVGDEEEQVETVDDVDHEFLESHLAQERKKQKRSNSDLAGGEGQSTQLPKKDEE
jgi:hypothetical protein